MREVEHRQAGEVTQRLGQRRVQRLYCAGLYTPEALGAAVPEDVAMVTGIPLAIARRCVEASASFVAFQLSSHVQRFQHEGQMVLELLKRRSDIPRSSIEALEGILTQTDSLLGDFVPREVAGES